MTFEQQVLASFLGTAFGFVFAILLFLITGKIGQNLKRETLRKHLKREFEYDTSLLQEWIDEIDKVLRKITADDHQVFSYLRYTFLQRSFMQEAFRSGIMYKALNNDEISRLNSVLLHCDFGIEQVINGAIQQWNSVQLSQQEALRKFEFEKEQLQSYKKHLQEIVKKLDK